MPWRRIVTIPGYVVAWSLWLGSAPLWLAIASLTDLVRRRRGAALCSAALVLVYLTCELSGMAASAGLWIWKRAARLDSERWIDLHFRLEAWWATTLFRAVVALFGLRVEIESAADLGRGPYLLFVRHASPADTLLAAALISTTHSLRLRYVLKRELLWDPCLDIVGNRLPNAFVDRSSDDSRTEVQRVQELCGDLGPHDGVLIYPEGTRFSESKRWRVIERLGRNGDVKMLEYARSLGFVLPPRHGGALGLLDAAPEADVVVCAHTGFESAGSWASIWNGELVNQTIRVQFRRIPRAQIPSSADERIDWLLEEWRRVDAWVERHR